MKLKGEKRDDVLTTKGVQDVKENVVTDINANVPLPGASAPRMVSPEAALLFNRSIVAKPLMVPEVCSIHIKNSEYRYRWVNAASQNGRVYMQRKAQGFINATTDDVAVLGGDAVADKGEIRAGDVVLMKIRADLYDAAIKWNMEKSMTLQRARGMYLKGANPDVMSDAAVSRVSVNQEAFNRTGKATNFIPDNPDSLMEGSAMTGGLQAAREQTKQIRDKIQASKAKED